MVKIDDMDYSSEKLTQLLCVCAHEMESSSPKYHLDQIEIHHLVESFSCGVTPLLLG